MSIWFVLQKTILFLLLPPSGILLIILAGFLVYRKIDRRKGVITMATGIALLSLLSTGIVSNLLIRPLENDHPPFTMTEEKPAAIVVLTSGVQDLSHLDLPPQPSTSSVVRLVQGIKLISKYPGIPLVICGGSGDPAKPDLSEAKALARVAVAAGIPERSILIEDRSVNTRSGAKEVAEILGPGKGKIALVTSAYHMDRSVRFFTEAGFSVIPAPADYRGGTIQMSLYSLIPSAGALFTSSTAISEFLSRLRYGMFF